MIFEKKFDVTNIIKLLQELCPLKKIIEKTWMMSVSKTTGEQTTDDWESIRQGHL